MKRVLAYAGVLAATFGIASAPDLAYTPQAAVGFEDFSPTTVSVVVRDVEKTAAAWADVLGLERPPIREPEVVYPPVFEGNRAGRPKMASLSTANMTVSLHQPPPGKNYWREMLETQGEALYRVNFRVNHLAVQTAYFERKGGRLVIGDTATTPYVNVNLWPRDGFAVELNAIAPSAPSTQTAPAPPPMLPAGSLASSSIFKIAFVVPNLDQAVKDYADLLGIPAASATRSSLPMVFPPGFTGDRHATVRIATLRFPNGVLLELNEPQNGLSIWRSHLQRHGRSIFSVGFRVTSVHDQVSYLTGKGGRLVLGGADASYAYFDFTSRLGTVIEVHE